MLVGRIGGMLIVGGCVLLAAAYATPATGPAHGDDPSLRDAFAILFNAALALLGSGAAVLSLAGTRPLSGRSVRVGLGMAGVGLLSLVVSSIIPIPAGSNSLQSWPYIIAGAVGLLATGVGMLVTVGSLVRMPGPPRVVGRLLLCGLLLRPFAAILSNAWSDPLLRSVAGVLEVVGFGALLLGLLGIGRLAFIGDRA